MCKVHPWTPETILLEKGGKRCKLCRTAYFQARYRTQRDLMLKMRRVAKAKGLHAESDH